MKLYKLTDQDGYTQRHNTGETLWKEGKTLKLKSCEYPQLCSSQVVHAYNDINLALLLNPCHANLSNPLLWEGKGVVKVKDWGKVGCFSLEIVKELPLPNWYGDADLRKRVVVQFAVLCAESVLTLFEKEFPNDNRPRKAIEAAREYLKSPADAADAAAYAAYAAAYAAYAAAARAARAADAEIDFAKLADRAVKLIEEARDA